MSLGWRIWRLAPWALGCLLVMGMTHICVILLIPHLSERTKLLGLPQGPGFVLVADGWSNENLNGRFGGAPWPYEDPASAIAVCLFDTTQGPTAIAAAVDLDGFLSLTFHDAYGRVFYSVNNRAAVRERLDAVIVNSRQLAQLEAEESEDDAPLELRLQSPTAQGFVLARALTENAADVERARAAVLAVECVQKTPR